MILGCALIYKTILLLAANTPQKSIYDADLRMVAILTLGSHGRALR